MTETNSIFPAPASAYLHIPFCVSKCFYCDFNSFPGLEAIFDDYVGALVTEIERASGGSALSTIYFGGGTPTLLSIENLSKILSAIRGAIGIADDAETTIEANPGTVDLEKLRSLRRIGFNRISIGVQSLDDDFLAKLGRAHSAQEAVEAYKSARAAGFDNVGIDLMFALPGQNVENWKSTLERAILMHPEHISLYELSIESGTRLAKMCAQGEVPCACEEDQLDMYELAISTLTAAGYEHYEVSNFARPGYQSRHNSSYWRNQPYYGFGAGATSYVDGDRSLRAGNPNDYIEAISSGGDPIDFSEHLAGKMLIAETMILGLRRLEGINLKELNERFGANIEKDFEPNLNRLLCQGLIAISKNNIRVTHQGLLLLNDVSQELLDF